MGYDRNANATFLQSPAQERERCCTESRGSKSVRHVLYKCVCSSPRRKLMKE